ncbi:MAG: site-2 protease family protein [Parachlamydiales bacterium]|nr:site-2 protease family protein [Parachlamydiales bacterium]
MFFNIFNIILAILGLGVLIFIHELGHYFMAKKVGMKVEVFSIGFGKPIYKWKRGKVQWQIGILPIGGYVKIAGMNVEKEKDPYKIPKGFFSKSPWKRIQVALMGPAANIVFAFFLFTLIWITGGREHFFSRYTKQIGWVDPQSELSELGVSPGDMITSYDNRAIQSFQDIYYASILKEKETQIGGVKIDYFHDTKTPFDYTLPTYSHAIKGMVTIGVLAPANYLIYEPSSIDRVLLSHSPMGKSGIVPSDRIVWVGGHLVFSLPQLRSIINTPSAFVTIERKGQRLQQAVPLIVVRDVAVPKYDQEEMDDWKHEAGLKTNLADLRCFPFYVNEDLKVEDHYAFIDKELEKTIKKEYKEPLEWGDHIVAVNGVRVSSASDLLEELQVPKTLVIVQNDPSLERPLSYKKVGNVLEDLSMTDLQLVIDSIGSNASSHTSGYLRLLSPIVPKTYAEIFSKVSGLTIAKEALEDKTLLLGIQLKDRSVRYNPNPWILSKGVFSEMGRVFSGLFSGTLHPKRMSGAVGIVQVFHYSWSVGVKEAIYWLGVISINLGIINLFPIPVFDGGHILFALYEMITRRKLKVRTMEKLVVPFIILLIAAFLYITYNDIMRIVERWMN